PLPPGPCLLANRADLRAEQGTSRVGPAELWGAPEVFPPGAWTGGIGCKLKEDAREPRIVTDGICNGPVDARALLAGLRHHPLDIDCDKLAGYEEVRCDHGVRNSDAGATIDRIHEGGFRIVKEADLDGRESPGLSQCGGVLVECLARAAKNGTVREEN